MSLRRIEIFYSGLVQGIGFRFMVERIASGLKLKGFVRNLSDGRVKVIAEGKEEDLKNLLDNLKEHFEGYIRNTQVNWFEATNEFEDFTIKF